MLDTQGQWSKALADNNIRAIIRWLQKLTAKGKADVEEILLTFSCWVKRTSEFAKNELLTLCLSHCQGLWMFLDHRAFTRVHMLLQRLRNLLTLAQWAKRHLSSAHLWHGLGIPCVVCRDTFCSSDVRRGCWNREHRALKQHILLGRLVLWWGIMGLLPKKPEAHEVKRISQMWKEMDHSHRNACLKTPRWEKGEMERCRSLIQGMVTQLNRQHGCIWTSEDCTDHCYPPPNLQALLMLVLVPHIDNMSVQALFMYFVLDLANSLQCKDDLLKAFCHAFTIPSSFSQQIRAFWMLDHGHIKASMELLLSPRTAAPCVSWQHHCIIHCLLMRKQPQLALRYLHWTRPAIESAEDAKLCADVLLLNSCVSEAWALLKKGHTESDNMVMYLLQACNRLGLCAKTLMCIPAECNGDRGTVNGTTGSQLLLMNKGRPPCPLSAKLYQAQRINTVSPEELVQLVRKAVMEVRKPHPKISEVVWPEHTERKSKSREMYLSTQALRHLTPSPSPMEMVEETKQTAHTDELEEEQPQHPESPKDISSSEDLSSESVSCFTSALSLPLLRRDRPYVYKSTLTLQRISSFLNDGENQSREEKEEEEEEEEESRTPSSVDGDADPDCLERTMTLDGATDPFFLGNLNNDVLVELVLSSQEGEEGVQTDVLSSEDFFSDAVSRISMDETLPANNNSTTVMRSANQCPPYVSPRWSVTASSHLTTVSEKISCCKGEKILHGPPDVTDLWSSALPLSHEEQSYGIPSEIFSFSEAARHQKTYEDQQQEEAVGCFNQDLSCDLSETTQNMLTDLPHSLLPEDNVASGPWASAGTAQQDIARLTPICSSFFPTQLQISGFSQTPSLTCNITTTSAPSDITNESSPKAQLKTDEPCVQGTSAWLNHCKMGSWWKQDLETCSASTGLLSAPEPGAAIPSGRQRRARRLE
ncbi:uncharacterized protein LOC116670422 isoform X1 [Etheostoma spectabile]|uniref:uncharacterized protein LOC116670422 isoform X1 n=1 Tax=Etheostoma spectabile TaxID=54343 RepID=UPI0013AEDDAE|nr:uncharacterized protein LOC116670422 isoform X1 [Etheostoma spectabile]